MDKINSYLKENSKCIIIDGRKYCQPTKRIVCKDGFTISVQANANAYCEPRENEAWSYSEVELGFPSSLDPLIAEYAEEPDTTETVFAYVPIAVVNELIDRHGGIFKNEGEA